MLRPLVALVALVALCVACRTTFSSHTIESQARLGPGGSVTLDATWTAPAPLNLRIDNRGPGRVKFTVTDSSGKQLESGECAITARTFAWKRADGAVKIELAADEKGAIVDYRFASQQGLTIQADVTKANSR
jgi:hypothetical protein